jgi:hypothetical protein
MCMGPGAHLDVRACVRRCPLTHSKWADRQDTSGRITNFLTVTFAFFGSIAYSASTALGALVNAVNVLNALIMLGCILMSMRSVQNIIKNFTGRLDFSNTVLGTIGPAAAIVGGWDLTKECKHRIWHPFWDDLLMALKPANAAVGPQFLRLQELKELTANNGLNRIKARIRSSRRHCSSIPLLCARRSISRRCATTQMCRTGGSGFSWNSRGLTCSGTACQVTDSSTP